MAYIDFYSKGSASSIANLAPGETYYTDSTNGVKINFNQHQSVYEIATTYLEEKKNEYYSYDKKTGRYTVLPTVDSFKNGETYYTKESYPLIPCDLSRKYFINKGYQEVSTFKAETMYYTKESNLSPEGEWIHKYTPAVFIKKDTWWYQDKLVNGGGEHCVAEGQNFERGVKYYKHDANGVKINSSEFLIPYEKLFIDHGYVEANVSDIDHISLMSFCYVLDSNNNPVWLPQGRYMLGKVNYYYKPEAWNGAGGVQEFASTLGLDSFTEGTFYARDTFTNTFYPLKVLKQFQLYSTYFSSVDAQYISVPPKSTHFYSNYYLRVPTSFGIYLYFPWSDIFDFNKDIMTLYVITEDGNWGYIGDGLNNRKKFSPVNRASAIYDEKVTYYAQAANGHLYEVVKQITTSNYKEQPWNLYAKNDDQKFKMLKHISFKKAGETATTVDGRVVTVGSKFLSSASYDPKTSWSYSLDTPEKLNFWFDFLDTDGELARYSNPAIGNRPKAENDDTVKAIYYRDTPNVIFVDKNTTNDELITWKQMKSGHTFINLSDSVENLFTISTQGKSAQDELNNLLYSYTYCTESVTINTLPVYHLLPNCRVFIKDDKTGINGEYIVTKITVPLTYNGTMNITATKAVERIY